MSCKNIKILERIKDAIQVLPYTSRLQPAQHFEQYCTYKCPIPENTFKKFIRLKTLIFKKCWLYKKRRGAFQEK